MKNLSILMKGILVPLCFTISYSKAQVGINTSNPQTIFHVDGAKIIPHPELRPLPKFPMM